MLSTVHLNTNSSISSESTVAPDEVADKKDQLIREKSKEFEAVFIGQMLKFSGFDKVLTMGGGSDASAFTGMYIQEFAEKIAENGGFGLAEKIYNQMSRLDTEGARPSDEGVDDVYPDKL